MATDVNVSPIENGGSITFNASDITWAAINSGTTNSFRIVDSISIDLSDESNWYIKEHTKEEPPKTYLSLPTGKRLISI